MSVRPLFLVLVWLVLSPVGAAHAQTAVADAPKSELDLFMERALARRDVNKKVLNDFILDERESFAILGPGRFPVHRTAREYTWFVKEGIHIRSPLKFDGVSIAEERRVEYEDRWLRRERARAERRAKGENEDKHVTISDAGIHTNVVPTEPGFVSDSYFMDFKFEPGNYFLAGREQLEGIDVVKIEYYPTKLFSDDDATDEKRKDTEQEEEERVLRQMNKTSMVTLWVDPKEHQIVKYTFQNVWMDFLPGAWLGRVDGIRASMTMFQPFAGVWLPRGIDFGFTLTLANGSFQADYGRHFTEYRQAEVKSGIKKVPDRPWDPPVEQSGPFVPEIDAPDHGWLQSPTQEVVREVRVHGNVIVSDEEVIRLAGVTVGQALDGNDVAGVERRLHDSGVFSSVEVRKRHRSLTDASDIAIILVVHEKVAVTVTPAGDIRRPLFRRLTSRVMVLPLITYEDGYGPTYGARFTIVDLLGLGERVSMPLTWGGTRRAALEAERNFERGPISRIMGSTTLWQRENPGFPSAGSDSTRERRLVHKARVESNLAGVVLTGVEATRASVEFGARRSEDHWTIGADAAIDTRANPNFPANAIYLGASWNALHLGNARVTNRYTVDGRAFVRVIGQPVLAGRVRYLTADGPLPEYERYLIGGSDTLRGTKVGAMNGTRFVVTSAELRVPVTSPVSGGRLGFTLFMDAVKPLDTGVSRAWHRSAGAGLFLTVSVIKLNLDVARGLGTDGRTRVHLSSGFSF